MGESKLPLGNAMLDIVTDRLIREDIASGKLVPVADCPCCGYPHCGHNHKVDERNPQTGG
jgi:hypothetical protein